MPWLPRLILALVAAVYYASEYFFPRWSGPWKMVPHMVIGVAAAIQLIRKRREANPDITLNIPR